MSDKEANTDKIKSIIKQTPALPWIPLVKLPRMDFRRPKIQMPHNAPHQYITILLVVFSSFLLAGGIYDLAEKNVLPLGFTQSGYEPIFPGLNDQFMVESFSIFIFVLLGTIGIFLIKRTTDAAKEGRPASTMLVLGTILLFLSVLSTVMMIQLKTVPIF